MRKGIALAVSAAALGVAANAFAAFTLNDGNATFNMTAAATNPFPTSNFSPADFRPEGGTSTDHMFYYNWAYRVPLGTNTGLSALVSPTQTVSGNTATFDMPNNGPGPVGQNRFDSFLTITLNDSATPHQAALNSTLRVTARPENTGPVTFQFFHVVDVDLNATLSDDVFSIGDTTGASGTVNDNVANLADFAAFDANAPGRYEVAASATIRGRINGGSANLANVANFSGDGGYGWQWEITLQPGESRTLTSNFRTIVPEPATLGLLALAAPALLRRRRA